MSSTVEHPVRKFRLSLSLKRSSNQEIAIKNNESDNNEKLVINKFSTCRETAASSCNNKSTNNDGNEEEEIIPCSQIEDKLVFSQKSVHSNCDQAQASIVPEQTKENSSSAETYFSRFSLEHDQAKDSSVGEDKIINIQDDNSTDTFDFSEANVSKILNESKDSERTEELSINVKETEISSSLEVDVCTIFNERKDNEKMECFSINEETVNVEEEWNEIPNSPEAKIFKILKENKGLEESKCEKKYNDLPPIVKRNVVIADSDEEFEEFVNQKRKSEKKIENTNTLNSQKENTSKRQEQSKISSSSCKEKSKVLTSRRDKSNVFKTSKEKSIKKSTKEKSLKRKLESAVENSDDEFEKPYKQAKKIQSPQRNDISKEVKKSKKFKKSRKSISLSTKNC